MLRIPSYRRHKSTGQARVTLGGKDFYLGRYGTRESREAYQRLIGEFVAGGGLLTGGDRLTVVELTAAYKRFAKSYYPGRDGQSSDWYAFIAGVMLRLGTSEYGRIAATEFGPVALKAFRSQMVTEGGGRKTINMKIDIVKRAYKWAASEELIPAASYHALRVVEGLRKGRSEARETAPVPPVDDLVVQATLPHLPVIVADMVRLQRLSGMRPAEVCLVRPCDIDTDREVWEYRPAHHKTEHHGRERIIFFGPQAQAILRPYLLREKSTYCFVPVESEAKRRAAQHSVRLTPPTHGNRPGTNCRRDPQWAPGKRYTTDSYRRSIQRGCEKAFGMPKKLDREARLNWRAAHVWSPNQLRHTAATKIRNQFGLEAAQISLGHAKADITQVYAERDLKKAAEIMRQVG